MPAQDIHIVKNPMDEELSPWYRVSDPENDIGQRIAGAITFLITLNDR